MDTDTHADLTLRSADPKAAVLAAADRADTPGLTVARRGKQVRLTGPRSAVVAVLADLRRSGDLGGLAYASAFAQSTN